MHTLKSTTATRSQTDRY